MPSKRRPSPVLVISILALIVASAGTAVGATRYLISSPKQIKPGAISGANLRDGSVDTGKLSPAAIARLRVNHRVISYVGTVAAGSTGTSVKVNCPIGMQATGGGYGAGQPTVVESRPDPTTGTPTAWVVTAINNSLLPADETQPVYVVCAG